MTLQRKPHWATRELHNFLLARAHAPFVWGTNDCALFAADAIKAITDIDIAADFRGKYATEAEAFALIQTVTGKGTDTATAVGDAAEWCAGKAGLVEIAPRFAQRGDLLVMEDSGRLSAGIVHLTGRHGVSVGHDGLLRLPVATWTRAWHV
jgi:hypothetical protein